MPKESTTPDLVELMRRFLDAANSPDLDTMMSFYAPDAVFNMTGAALGPFEGGAAIRGFHEDWWGAYEEYEIQTEEVLDLGNGVVLVVLRQNARPVGSTGHVQTQTAGTSEWEHGKIARVTVYHDIDEARAAAEQLAEERAQADV